MTAERVVVVGGGLAGATVIRRLRDLGHEGSLTLVGAEQHVPYERPELSKGYLAGRSDFEKLQVIPRAGYAELDVALRLGEPATGLDTARRRLRLGAEDLSYDVLVVATGSSNVRPKLSGMELDGVLQLRTVEDADALRRRADPGSHVVLVGAGFIGCEVAATLRSAGAEVTLVDAQPGPLWGPLGQQLSQRVRAWHERSGVRLLMGVGVAALQGAGAVQSVLL
ncbi:MAG: NAD(P)/FAD-dependent oxidoreductase, partial [Mycobacteriales bacterium]